MKHLVFALALLAGSVLAAEEVKDFGRDRLNSSPRHADWVDIKSGARSIKAFVVYPERKDKAPAVVVISEIFGLTDWVRSLCDELAENGVIAIAPDLHGGQKFEDLDGARKATSAAFEGTGESGSGRNVGLCAHENSRVQWHARGVRILLGRGRYVRVCE